MYVKNKKTNTVYTAVASSSNASNLVEPSHSDRPGYVLTNDDTTIFVDTFRMYDKYTVLTDAEVLSSVELLTGIVPRTLTGTFSLPVDASDIPLTVIPTLTFNFIPTTVAITVTGGELTTADYTVTSDEEVYTITFDEDALEAATAYTITATATQEATSRTLTVTRKFTTAEVLELAMIMPEDESTDVTTDSPIGVMYSMEIDDNNSTFVLTKTSDASVIPTTLLYSDGSEDFTDYHKGVLITPTASLTASTGYTLTCNAKTYDEQTLETIITFTTSA